MNQLTRPVRREHPLYDVAQIRDLEQRLFAQRDSYRVMQDAAAALFTVIISDFPNLDCAPFNFAQGTRDERKSTQGERSRTLAHAKPASFDRIPFDCAQGTWDEQKKTFSTTVHVILGAGNNAGDGLLTACLLKQRGFDVHAYRVFEGEFSGDAHNAFAQAIIDNLDIQPFSPFEVSENDIIIEAIFGIGLSRPAENNAKRAIDYINRCQSQYPSLTVYAVDVPAGISADTGACIGNAVYADKTVTFIGDKIGLHTADGKAHAGEVVVAPLDAPVNEPINKPVNKKVLCHRYDYTTMPATARSNAHKGDFGHALIIGGGRGMFGAAALASVSALKVGTGKASVYSHADYASQFHLDNTPLYEVMRKNDLSDFSAYTAVVLGVGLGRDAWGKSVFQQTLQAVNQQPLLIDADGLWHLAEYKDPIPNLAVITPHEAEAARLLGCTVAHIRADKPSAVRHLAQQYRCLAVLKGTGTLISDGERIWLNTTGNVCLATAGSGDVLAGMIGGYLAQGFDALEATLYGVFRHGQAADSYLHTHQEKTLRASDLWGFL